MLWRRSRKVAAQAMVVQYARGAQKKLKKFTFLWLVEALLVALLSYLDLMPSSEGPKPE
jgi:hypothetical protein